MSSPPKNRIKVALVTNIPTPYRIPVFERVAKDDNIELTVIYFSRREPDRLWDLDPGSFRQIFLKERFFPTRGRFIHINPDIWGVLRKLAPNVVITTGFNPSHLLAFIYARIFGAKHVAMTDGTFLSEAVLGIAHRCVRSFVYSRSTAFIGASYGSFQLYHAYGIDSAQMFKSHLCSNNELFAAAQGRRKHFDFIFCARFIQDKNPLFALEVARGVAKRLGRRISIAFVGSGELEPSMRAASKVIHGEVDAQFLGFASQADLPSRYADALIFLFPTRFEVWGVVANEACAAGLPVLISPTAGSARELIQQGENGYILPLEINQWVDASVRLLSDPVLYGRMSLRSRELVRNYSYDKAALGIVNASRQSFNPSDVGFTDNGEAYVHRPRVVIIQRRMVHYRVPLFNALAEELAKRSIDLVVAFGDATKAESTKADVGNLSWGVHLSTRYLLGAWLCWQNAVGVVKGADLVVVTQENKLLFNHLLLLQHRPFQLAFWGHGRNFQASRFDLVSEKLKRWIATRPNWWFAYTDTSADLIRNLGFSETQITVLNNSIDCSELAKNLQVLSPADIARAKRLHGIGPGPVGIMIGSLYKARRLAFLIESAKKIRTQLPDFQLLVIGDGPDRSFVDSAARNSQGWIHYLGMRKGKDKALFLAMSNVMLNPGAVGLSVLDSFAAGVPCITTDCGLHGPEISYLKSEVNGLITPNSVAAFSKGAIRILSDDGLYASLKNQCSKSAHMFSLELMVERFCDGIEKCLSQGNPNSKSVFSND
jgi:glycosyltransferase involved in cell wall biosynthesis